MIDQDEEEEEEDDFEDDKMMEHESGSSLIDRTCSICKKLFLKPSQLARVRPGNTKGGSIALLLTSCLTGLDQSVLQI